MTVDVINKKRIMIKGKALQYFIKDGIQRSATHNPGSFSSYFIKLSDFGTFSVGTIAEREVYNPLAGGTVFYAETKKVRFKTSKVLRDRINA